MLHDRKSNITIELLQFVFSTARESCFFPRFSAFFSSLLSTKSLLLLCFYFVIPSDMGNSASVCHFHGISLWIHWHMTDSVAEDPGFESRLRRDFFRARVIPVTSKLALLWLHCQAPGVIGSALRLVDLVSVYCDWVRWKVCNFYLSVAARNIV